MMDEQIRGRIKLKVEEKGKKNKKVKVINKGKIRRKRRK